MKNSIQSLTDVCTGPIAFTFLVSGRRHVWILGLFLDVEVDIVLFHVEVDRGGGVAVHRRLEAADRRPFAGAGGVWAEGGDGSGFFNSW